MARLRILGVISTMLMIGCVSTLCFMHLAHAQPSLPGYKQFDIGPVPSMTANAAWSARSEVQVFRTVGSIPYYVQNGLSGSTLMSAPAGSFLMLGGSADIWVSPDGLAWNPVAGPITAQLPYIPNSLTQTYAYAPGQCITKDVTTDTLYVIQPQQRIVFISTNGGQSWSNSTSPFPGSLKSIMCTVDTSGTVFTVYGAFSFASNDRGLTWRWRADSPWGQKDRWAHFGGSYKSTLYNKDFIFVLGGRYNWDDGAHALNDVWVTSDGAITWFLLSSNAPWAARYDTRLAITNSGVLVLAGGRPSESFAFNDVWTSVDGGFNWWLLRNHASYAPRSLAGMAVDAGGYVWLYGGIQYSIVQNFPQFTDTNLIDRSSLSFNSINTWGPAVNPRMYSYNWDCLGLVCFPNQTCACSEPYDFNFNQLPSAPWTRRFGSHVLQLQYPINYRGRDASGTNLVSKTAPAGAYFMYGGWNWDGVDVADGWVTSDLRTWEPIYGTAAAAIGLTEGIDYVAPVNNPHMAMCSKSTSSGNRFYTMAGDYRSDVWTSTNGVQWTRVSNVMRGVPLGLCGILSDDTVWFFSGWNFRYSTNTGSNWTVAKYLRPPTSRIAMTGGSYRSNLLNKDVVFIMAGVWDNKFKNDVWITTDLGSNWYMTTSAAAWPARADASGFVTSSGILVITFGQRDNHAYWFNDAWFSVDGGYNWYELTSSDAVLPRSFPGLAMVNLGQLLTVGGAKQYGGPSNDIYISDPKFPLASILEWGKNVDPSFKPPSDSSCIGLTCIPNATCLCGTRQDYNMDIRNAPGVTKAAWAPRTLVSVFRTFSEHTWQTLNPVFNANTNTTNYYPGTITAPPNSWIMIDGDAGSADVWTSMDKGRSWRAIAGMPNNSAIPNGFWRAFVDLNGQALCKSPNDDAMYIMGGNDTTTWRRDVWSSMDGQAWVEKQNRSATGPKVWPGRTKAMCSVDTDGFVYVTGGTFGTSTSVVSDTYRSTDGGITWDLVSSGSVYPGRAAFFGGGRYERFQGKSLIYAIGGFSFRNFNDVWVTSDGAKSWALLTANAAWSARADTTVAFTDNGVMVLYGGQMNNFERFLSDMWMSLDGGYSWWLVAPMTSIQPRSAAALVADEDGFMWVMGGNVMGSSTNDVYRSSLSFSNDAIQIWGQKVVPGMVIPRDAIGNSAFGLACWLGATCQYVSIPMPVKSSSSSSSSSLSGGAIAGIVIGVLVGVILVALCAVFMLRRDRAKSNTSMQGGYGGGNHSFQPQKDDVELSTHHAADTNEENA